MLDLGAQVRCAGVRGLEELPGFLPCRPDDLLGLGPRVFGAIAVYNWLSVLSTAIQVPISIAIYVGLDPEVGTLLGHGAAIFVTACEFFVFKRLLDIAFEAALALAVADFFLGWLIVQELIVPLALGRF